MVHHLTSRLNGGSIQDGREGYRGLLATDTEFVAKIEINYDYVMKRVLGGWTVEVWRREWSRVQTH